MKAGPRNTGNAMPVPLHLQIQADIMGAIERGDFPVGEQLPSETELQARYGVSRATIRKAMEELSAGGVVMKLQGLGTYVNDRVKVGQSVRLRGYLDDILISDERLSFRTLAIDDVQPAPDIAALFAPADRGAATRYRSLILQAGKPLMIGTSHIPVSVSPRVDDAELPPGEQQTVVRLRRAGLAIQRGQQTLGAIVADAEQASHLGVQAGTALIASRRLYYDRSDRPLIVIDGIFHPTNYSLVVDLVPRPGGRFVSPSR